MSRIIPNENTWIGIITTADGIYSSVVATAPTDTVLAAAHNITDLIQGIDPTYQGNVVPTPSLAKKFESSIMGTRSGSISGEMYRDDAADAAWSLLPMGTKGYLFISRFGGLGLLAKPNVGQTVEVWPFEVSNRAPAGLANNTVQTFTLNAAVPSEPQIDVTVVAGTPVVPLAPRNLTASKEATGIIVLDWDAPLYDGGAAITGYEIWGTAATGAGALTSAGPFTTKLTSNFTEAAGPPLATSARITGLAAQQHWYEVKAVNSAGSSAFSNPAGANAT